MTTILDRGFKIQILKQDSEQDKKEGKPYQFLYNEYRAYNQTPSTASRKDDAIDSLSLYKKSFLCSKIYSLSNNNEL